MFDDMPRESILFLLGILLTSVLIPLTLPIFRRCGVVDRPNARSTHTMAVPRGMGLVVVVTFVVLLGGYSLLLPSVPLERPGQLEALLWSIVLLVAVGFIDDTRGVRAGVRLIFQVGSAVILIAAGFVMPLPAVFGDYQALAEQACTLLWIVGCINAVNFIDGSDGLATTLSALCMLLFVGISRILPLDVARASLPLVKSINLLGLAGAGCALPFLLYNLTPAKCFLGDAGSTFFGLLLATLGILITQCPARAAQVGVDVPFALGYLLVPWLVLFVPIADAVRVTAGRALSGQSPFRPDNRHLHHVLQRAGLSPNQILFLVALTSIVFGLFAAIIVRSTQSPYILIGAALLLVYGMLWFFKSSYQAQRFLALALNRRLLKSGDLFEGYENMVTFKNRFEQELARARRHGGALTVLVVSANHARYSGYGAAPLENPRFLDTLLRLLRREDIKCRLSTDRLAFLLIETDKELASHVCDRIRFQFDSIRQGESSDLEVTFGTATFPLDGLTMPKLLETAEEAAIGIRRPPAPAAPPSPVPAGLGPEVVPAPAAEPHPAALGASSVPGIPAAAAASGEARPRWEASLAEKDALVSRASPQGAKRWFTK
jgi:UDP-GlcNAc:undecaprenyl-phosphate GlcNAc-1-phosphate transferase